MDISGLEPRALWANFMAICSIPHPSHHEKQLCDWVIAKAKESELEHFQDSRGNVIVKKPASAGREANPGIILQAHLDMVPQARAGSKHDFTKDPIVPRRNPNNAEWLIATDTTLGADNGLGAAAMLAVMEDKTMVHGPLEFLFTVNEEDGMTGARQISPSALSGKYLLNLDGEEADELTIGCTGSVRTASTLMLRLVDVPAGIKWLSVQVSGLLGGHSGMDIHRGRGNANIALCRLLAKAGGGSLLASLQGGDASNAIPRDASALAGIPASGFESWKAAFESEAATIRSELGKSDPGFRASYSDAPTPGACLSTEDSRKVQTLVYSIPNGLVSMEPDMPGSTRTSSNLGIVTLSSGSGNMATLETLALIRSSSDFEKEQLTQAIDAVLTRSGAATERKSESLAWTPEPGSPLLKTAKTAYKEIFGSLPKVVSTHGGLECGLFRPIYPRWDMISFGPTIRSPHSPDETTHIPSASIFWRYLITLLNTLA